MNADKDGRRYLVEPPYDPTIDGPEPEDPVFDVEPNFTEPSAEKRSRGAQVKPSPAPSQAVELVKMAVEKYRIVKSTEGKIYAVEHQRPGIALDLRGGKEGLRQRLSSSYFDERGKVPTQSALTDMLNVLEGQAMRSASHEVHLRFAAVEGSVFVDLGTPEGAAVEVMPGSWTLHQNAPVLFRRNPLLLPIPTPVKGGSLEGLRQLLNVSEEGFRLLIGWLVAACLPNIPRPILALFGQQGTAKTTALTTLRTLIDPSAAPVQALPTTPEDWAVMGYQAPIVALDNVSRLSPWLQDALCRAVTGDGVIRRERYSDDQVSVLYFKRAIAMTSIDPGSLQGDVADRLLTVELEAISENSRITEAEVQQRLAQIRPATLGALLDLLAQVLTVLPNVNISAKPRMADFANVLASIDQITGWNTLNDYLASRTETAFTVVDGSAFASAVRDLVGRSNGSWAGTAQDLLDAVSTDRPPRNWPKTARGASGELKRITPALKLIGLTVSERKREAGTGRRGIVITQANTALCTACDQPLDHRLAVSGMTEHPGC